MIWRLVALCCLLLPTSARAQQAPDVDVELIQQLTNLIRWGGLLTSTFVLLGAWLVLRFVDKSVERLSLQFAEWRLTLQKFQTIFQFATYIGSGVVVTLLSFRIDDKVLALIGGTLAVSIGFAVKDLVASMVAGVVIMADRPFQVGDRVSFAGEYGDIASIGLRSVRIQTLDDNTVTVPNNKFLTEPVSSGNYGELDMQVTMDFLVHIEADIDLARRLVHDAAISSRYIHLPKPISVHVQQVVSDHYLAVRLRLKAYVFDTRHERAFETDVNLRVLRAFRAQGIAAPRVLVTTRETARPSA